MAENLGLPASEHETAVLGWSAEALQEGEAFLKSQSGFSDIDRTIEAIMGDSKDFRPTYLSALTDNRLGKIALNLAAALTDIKPFWEYRTFNKRFEQQAQLGGKLSHAWWHNRFIDLKYADVVKWALAAGSGYAHLTWRSELNDQDLIAEDPRDVLPIRPNSLVSLQDALGVIIRREFTTNYLRSRYPYAARRIKADRDISYATRQQQSRTQKLLESLGSPFLSNLYASLGQKAQPHLRVPAADLFTIYLHDDRVNKTGRTVKMGQLVGAKGEKLDTNWTYEVEPGKALYPRGRCIVFTRTAVLYDDSNIYWHGLFPVSKLTLDPWPWSWLGKSPLKDALPLQAELDRMMRAVSDHNEKAARPDLVADKNALSRAAMGAIDTRRSGLKLRHNPVAGQPPQLVYPGPLDSAIAAAIADLRTEMETLTGERDLSQLVRLGQIPSAETVEKILEAMSPAVRLRSRVMEAFLREFAMMTLSNFFQFYTTAQRVAVLGPSGLTFEDFDYDPGTLIPDFIAEEDFDEKGNVLTAARDRGPLPRSERARTFLREFTYHVAPGSLLSASEITRKLLFLQLARMGYVDAITLLEVLGVPNVGAPESAGSTIMERLQWQQSVGLGMQVGPAGASAAGRKATAQQMPRMTIKES